MFFVVINIKALIGVWLTVVNNTYVCGFIYDTIVAFFKWTLMLREIIKVRFRMSFALVK